jgi:hypothetical protein
MAGATDERFEPAVRGPIRVTLPAAVAYDPDRLKTSIGSILERIGCRSCCSGADIYLQMERNFLVDPETNVETLKAGASVEYRGRPHQFAVGLSPTVKYDIDRVFQAIDKVIDLLGPHPCISGVDVLLQDELRAIVVNERLEAQRFDQQF